MNKHGIDVSYHQGVIDWDGVSRSDFRHFAVLRIGYMKDKAVTDEQFNKNVKGCEDNYIPYGCYYYSYATTVAEAHRDAKNALKACEESGANPLFIAFDYERASEHWKKPNDSVSDMAIEFCKTVEEEGIKGVIYSNEDTRVEWFGEALNHYALWYARYPDSKSVPYLLWQYSDSGRVKGIDTPVDLDIIEDSVLDALIRRRDNGIERLDSELEDALLDIRKVLKKYLK